MWSRLKMAKQWLSHPSLEGPASPQRRGSRKLLYLPPLGRMATISVVCYIRAGSVFLCNSLKGTCYCCPSPLSQHATFKKKRDKASTGVPWAGGACWLLPLLLRFIVLWTPFSMSNVSLTPSALSSLTHDVTSCTHLYVCDFFCHLCQTSSRLVAHVSQQITGSAAPC